MRAPIRSPAPILRERERERRREREREKERERERERERWRDSQAECVRASERDGGRQRVSEGKRVAEEGEKMGQTDIRRPAAYVRERK